MMRAYIALSDGTNRGYGELLPDDTVPSTVMRAVDGGFCIAYGALPSVRWAVEVAPGKPIPSEALEGQPVDVGGRDSRPQPVPTSHS